MDFIAAAPAPRAPRQVTAWVAKARGLAMVARMTKWLVAALVGLGMSFLCAAETPLRVSKPEVKKEIVAIVEAQLAAFRKGDVKKAYTYAAADLQAQKPFKTFTAIVQTNYPEIWANTRAEFGLVHDDGVLANVTVQVYSKTGDAAYDFTLRKERPGWRIYGVVRHEPSKTDKA
jgi:hypothetical protein